MSDLERLESSCGLENRQSLAVTKRLELLEERLLGYSFTGAIVPRLERLKDSRKQALFLRTPEARMFPGDSLPLLNAFPPNFLRVEEPGSPYLAKIDYFDEVKKASNGKSIHFRIMPVPIYVQSYSDREFINCVLKACESWETKTSGAVRFAQVGDPSQSRIRVIWKHLGAKADSDGCLLGAHTVLNYKDRGNGSLGLMSVGAIPLPVYIPRFGPKYQVPPQIMEVNLDLILQKNASIRYRCLQNIITHELGHALGLLGHSPSKADMMYSVTDEHSRLSQRDINTLKRLYENKIDIPL